MSYYLIRGHGLTVHRLLRLFPPLSLSIYLKHYMSVLACSLMYRSLKVFSVSKSEHDSSMHESNSQVACDGRGAGTDFSFSS